jgi:hypothetical protein
MLYHQSSSCKTDIDPAQRLENWLKEYQHRQKP